MTPIAKRVLIIRFSSIGDIVLTTPIVRCLKRQLGAEIHYLTKQNYASLLAANPYVDQIHTIQERVGDCMPSLKQLSWDLVVDLHKNLRSRQVRRGLRAPSASFDKINLAKWLKVNLKVDRLPDVHIVDRYFQATGPLEVTYDGEGLDFFLPEDIQVPDLPQEPYACVAIGGAHETKKMPTTQLRQLCEGLPTQVLVVGGPQDRSAGEALDQLDHVHNLAGQLSISESAYVLSGAAVVISHDTGMMHIAAALRRPILSIWGNTIPAFGMYPFYPKGHNIPHHISEVPDLACRPCSKIGHAQCPKGHFRCMVDQDPRLLAEKAVELMSSYLQT